MKKNTKRALRRHHLARMKAKAKRVYHFEHPEKAAKYADNLKVCSRYCCGNRRRYEGLSLAELRALQPEE